MLIPIPNDPKTRRQATAVIQSDVSLARRFLKRIRDHLYGVDVWAAILNDHGNGD